MRVEAAIRWDQPHSKRRLNFEYVCEIGMSHMTQTPIVYSNKQRCVGKQNGGKNTVDVVCGLTDRRRLSDSLDSRSTEALRLLQFTERCAIASVHAFQFSHSGNAMAKDNTIRGFAPEERLRLSRYIYLYIY